jgi:hypothetical protein
VSRVLFRLASLREGRSRGAGRVSATREIHLAWDAGQDGMRRLTAECDDEITPLIFMGPPIFDESDVATLLTGEFGRMAVEEHRGRCAVCQAWVQERAS